jgi:tetratricopeptide (TPR) repeat protein
MPNSVLARHEKEPASDAVLHQLNRILNDARFTSSTRHARFLDYVVRKALDDKAAEIKEIVIATEVYGRPGDYDPKVDSIVRVEATRLRSKLDSYYEAQGARDPVRIRIPKGTYVPKLECFSPVEEPQQIQAPKCPVVAELQTPTEPPVSPASRPMFSRQYAWAGLLISGLIAAALVARGGARVGHSHDPHPAAYAAWVEGNELLRHDPNSAVSDRGMPPILDRVLDRYEFAVAKDPNFARAWASLAEAYDYASAYVGRDIVDDARRAEAAARRAVALDDNLPAGHAMLALVLFSMRWNFTEAEREYRRAIELDPRAVFTIVEYTDLLRRTGRVEEAEAEIRKARALMPKSPVLAVMEAEIQLNLKQPDAAMATANSVLRMTHDFRRAHVALGMAWEAKGNFEQALSCYRKALVMHEQDRRALPSLGYVLGRMGRREEARAVALQLEDIHSRVRNSAFQLAVVYAGLGEHERALDWLERAHQTRQAHLTFIAAEYRFEPLRQHPRFLAILNKVGLKVPPA